MAGISYKTHTYCSNCVEHFSKKDYPDIIWCPNKCKTRVRYNAKSVLSKRKKHQFTRIDSSSNPLQGTKPQHYMIKKQSGSMKSKDDPLTNQDVKNLYALTIVKEQLEGFEKLLNERTDMDRVGRLFGTMAQNMKQMHDLINVNGVIDEVIKYQDQLKKQSKSKKKKS